MLLRPFPGPSTLVELLLHRAAASPQAVAYTFLTDGEAAEETLDYGAFAQRALSIAGLLQQAGARGEPVLLLFPPGLEYVAAFLGCVCAGAIAVPAYPPDPSRLGRALPRLAALVADARARFALTTSPIRELVEAMGTQIGSLASLTWLAVEEAGEASRDAWCDPGARAGDTALLQYTSGSTGTPRGVIVSHANLLHNSAAIHRCFEHGDESRGVIWLPPYHDMGLIGGALQPLYGGFPVVLMSPLAFLARPFRWLQAISRYRATTSGGPNFAYDLCVRKVTAEQRASLDLSSWKLAFNGAEPIHPETLDRFVAAFGPCGFRREAFYPCYGLAEGTLIVSGGRKGSPTVIRSFARTALDHGEAIPRNDDEADAAVRTLVGCGATLIDQEVVVVDPERRQPLARGRVGEIWVRGPSVAGGYWGRAEETATSFQARRADTDVGGYLRTGDLGFLVDGELFVTGRLKDLLIIRGRNLYPQDLERTALGCDGALRPGCAAAFSIEARGDERLAIVLEAEPKKVTDAPALLDAIRRAVAEEHEVQVHTIVLLPPGSLPKTSSGKVQRRAAREQLLAGGFAALAESNLATAPAGVASATEPVKLASQGDLLALDAPARSAALVAIVRGFVAELLGIAASAVDPERPLTSYGFDSIMAVELGGRVDEVLGVELPMSFILDGASTTALAVRVAATLVCAPAIAAVVVGGEDALLSPEQERLLFLEQLAPGNPAYNIATSVFLDGHLDRDALARSLGVIVERHAVLRARYPRRGGRVTQLIAPREDPAVGVMLVEEELVAPPETDRDAAAMQLALADARRPFDLERGPVLRVRCIRVSPTRHLLVLVVHHVAADGWSMGVFVRELGALYSAIVAGQPAELPPLALQYADFAARKRRWIEDGGLGPELAFWKRRLAGAPPLLELPADHARPAVQSFAGARCPLEVDAVVTSGLKRLAAAEGATLYMALLTGFFALVHQRTGRVDLLVGTDVAGRSHAQAQRLIGLFVNQLVLRVDASGDPSFRALLGRVRATALEAYEHDRVPFDKLVEALRPPRDPRHNPLFQLMFVLESAPLPDLTLPGLSLETHELDDGGSPFDLSVLLAERGGRLGGVFRYDTALFEPATITEMVDDYAALLADATARPETTLSELAALVADRARHRKEAQAEALRVARLERFRALPRR